MRLPVLFQFTMLPRISSGLMIDRCFHDRFHTDGLPLFLLIPQVIVHDFQLFRFFAALQQIQIVFHHFQIPNGFHKTGMRFLIRSPRRILLLPLHQKIPIASKLLIAVRHLVKENILIAYSVLFFYRYILLISVMLNPEIIGQLLRCRHGREIKKAAGEINHITIRLAAKAVKSCVNLHAWILVIVERTPAHAPALHPHAVALSGLKGGHVGFYFFKQRHLHHRSCSGFFFSACAAGRSRFSFASSSAKRALLDRSSSSCGNGLPSSALAVAIC